MLERITTTPFGQRPVTAALLANQAPRPALSARDKWAIFRDLCAARKAFGLGSRTLTVLSALLSFHRPVELDGSQNLIVFPSNARLSERAHGIPQSTLRRHLALLVDAGLIARHDSPTGKRYAARDAAGGLVAAFGFDLGPLLARAGEAGAAAAEAAAQGLRVRRLRERISLGVRDCLKLAEFVGCLGGVIERCVEVKKVLRRNLEEAELCRLALETEELRSKIAGNVESMSGPDARNERLYQDSQDDESESEVTDPLSNVATRGDDPLQVAAVLEACPDILPYSQNRIDSRERLVSAAAGVYRMMGIPGETWHRACRAMGEFDASVVVLCILQSITRIQRPGPYLRALSDKAEKGGFSPGPMVRALTRGRGAVAA